MHFGIKDLLSLANKIWATSKRWEKFKKIKDKLTAHRLDAMPSVEI